MIMMDVYTCDESTFLIYVKEFTQNVEKCLCSFVNCAVVAVVYLHVLWCERIVPVEKLVLRFFL